jgi:uncharacterized SAM-binding protein YcdF (DUF218 family)
MNILGVHGTRRPINVISHVLAAWGLALTVVLFTPLVDWLGRRFYVPDTPESADAIVVLGAWVSETGELNESGMRRSLLAAELYRSGVARFVVVTGDGSLEPGAASAVGAMAQLIRYAGVPEAAIECETGSDDTHESAIHIASLAQTRKWSRIALVTDALHMYRSVLAFRKAGLTLLPRSASFGELQSERPTARLRKLTAIVHEYGGLLYYWWRDWI